MTEEETRAAAYRAQEQRRMAYMQQLRAAMHGDSAAAQGLYDRTRAVKGPYENGSGEIYELEEYITGEQQSG